MTTERVSPDWVRGGLVQLRDEVVLFLRTLWGFFRHPRQFTRKWLHGEVHGLNPFGYLLTAIGIVGAVQVLFVALSAEKSGDATLVQQVAGTVLPPLYFLGLGLTTHLLLWVLGSRVARLRDTAAIALYASGPSYIGDALLLFVVAVVKRCHASHLVLVSFVAPLALFSLLAFAIPFVAALREVHDLPKAPWTRSIFAFVTVFVLSGFFFGGVRPPGSYGLHPTIWPPSNGHEHWSAYFGDH